MFGGDDGQGATRHAYVARVPHGRLAEPGAWRYWDGSDWTRAPRPRPVLGDGERRGVGSAFTVVRDGGTYVLFTMAAGTAGLTRVSSYWACTPTGPWHGPAKGFDAPLPRDGALPQGTAAYNPQAHPALGGGDGRLLLSYDVNWLDAAPATAQAQVSGNVSLYRPRFVALRLRSPALTCSRGSSARRLAITAHTISCIWWNSISGSTARDACAPNRTLAMGSPAARDFFDPANWIAMRSSRPKRERLAAVPGEGQHHGEQHRLDDEEPAQAHGADLVPDALDHALAERGVDDEQDRAAVHVAQDLLVPA